MNASPVNKKKCSKILSFTSFFPYSHTNNVIQVLLNQKEKDMLVFQSQQPPNQSKNM